MGELLQLVLDKKLRFGLHCQVSDKTVQNSTKNSMRLLKLSCDSLKLVKTDVCFLKTILRLLPT